MMRVRCMAARALDLARRAGTHFGPIRWQLERCLHVTNKVPQCI